jgi:aminoglycoside phosphotransferase (APT) family kinase protein
VTGSDPRCYPLVELDGQQIREMLSPVLGGAKLHEYARVEGGLVNTIYFITTGDAGLTYALRVYGADSPVFEMEVRLLSQLAEELPVPRVLFADASGRRCKYPYLVYQWIEGISLNECRRQSSPEAFLKLAEPLGRLLAQIAGTAFPINCLTKTIHVTSLLERAAVQLRASLARERLGGALADDLRDRLEKNSTILHTPDQTSVLVHGDFGGRNILVDAGENGKWGISGVIDWEEAAVGPALWDVGSLFRYPRRYAEEFRALFARGYNAAGGRLPRDWWLVARTIDAMRLVAILSEERELPGVFADCVELIQSIVVDLDQNAS